MTNVIVRNWWEPELITRTHYERAAERIKYWQRRNAAATKSHRKTRIAKLAARGIEINTLQRCTWP